MLEPDERTSSRESLVKGPIIKERRETMTSEAQNIALARRRHLEIIGLPLLFFALALSYGLPSALAPRPPHGDEVRFVLPTIRFTLEHGRPPVYLCPSSYMAPVQESLAAGFSNNEQTLIPYRVLGAIFTAAAAGLVFIYFRSILEFKAALVCSIWSAALLELNFGRDLPGYPVGIATLLGFLILALSRWSERPVLMGASAGLLYYIFPVSGPLLIAYVLLKADLRGLMNGRRPPVVLAISAVACLLPFTYLKLTGHASLSTTATVLAAFGVILAATAAIFAVVTGAKERVSRNRLTWWALFGTVFVAIALSAHLAFVYSDRQLMLREFGAIYRGSDYVLRAWTQWPFDAYNLFFRVVPMALIPALRPTREAYAPGSLQGDWRSFAAGVLLTVCFIAGSVRLLRSRRLAPSAWTYPVGAFLMMALMLPSWRLVGDYSARYLYPFAPALVLIVVGGARTKDVRPPG